MSEEINSQIIPIGVSDMARFIGYAILANRPATFWSKPGVGKSAIMQEVAAHFGFHLEDIRLSQIESIDLRGAPTKSYINIAIDENGKIIDEEFLSATAKEQGTAVVEWAMPDFLLRARQMARKGIPTLFFFDELNHGDEPTQAAAYQFILEKRIGCFALNEKDRIFGACNFENEGSIANPMSVALANRLTHYYVEHDVEGWIRWAYRANIHHYIIAAVQENPELLYSFPDDEGMSKNKAFNTPRTLQYASDYLYVITEQQDQLRQLLMNNPFIEDNSEDTKEIRRHIEQSYALSEDDIDHDLSIALAGNIGTIASREIMNYIKIGKDLPKAETILSGRYRELTDFKVEENRTDIQALLSNQCINTLYKEYKSLQKLSTEKGSGSLSGTDSNIKELEDAKHKFFERYENFIWFSKEHMKQNLFIMSIIVRLIREMRINPIRGYMKRPDTVSLVLEALRGNVQDKFSTV